MSTLKDGSHIKVFRGYYSHHGIYIGGNKVIHYDGKTFSPGCICECSLEDFANGGTIEIVTHLNGYNPDDVIRRARSLKQSKQDSRTIAIETGIQNAGTAILVTGTILQNPTMTIVPVMYGILMLIPTFAYLLWIKQV
ncbi:MAG: lecithin retinol acyltransferase family protein [Pseudomonadota bacterium]